MSDFKKLYDDLYNEGYHRGSKFTHATNLIHNMYKFLDKGSRILDVGCSNGAACLLLSDLNYVCSGVDILLIF